MKRFLSIILCLFMVFAFSPKERAYAESNDFVGTYYANLYGVWETEAKIGNYFYQALIDGELKKTNLISGETIILAHGVTKFVTDGKSIYYSSYSEQEKTDEIYYIDCNGQNQKKVLSGENISLLGCWKNKYLYYEVFDFSKQAPEYTTWMYDLQNNQKKALFDRRIGTFRTYGNRLFYIKYIKNSFGKDAVLFTCNIDGSNEVQLFSNTYEFNIINNELYYAKYENNTDYDLNFHIEKSSVDGNNRIILTDVIRTDLGVCQKIYENKISILNYNYITEVNYKLPEISVLLDDKKITFDQQPVIIDGRTLVPLRAIFEELGATVLWNGTTKTVTSTKGTTTISMTIGKKEMYKNGKLITLDVAPQLVGGRTLVPVRAVAEGFDCKVDWDGNTRTVIINTLNTEKVIHAAKQLYQANEKLGGATNLATYAEVDATLYKTLGEIDKTLAVNEFTLDMVSAGTKATIAAAKISAGNYSSVDNLGDGLTKLLSSSEIADAADGVLKDAIKQRVLKKISSSVPDINTLILNMGRSAYEDNAKMILDLIMVHSKFKSGNYTYDDAVAYIVLNDTLIMNRKTMSMAVEVLSDKLPQNFLESLLMSTEASAKAVLSELFGDAFSGRKLSISAELFTDIVTAYTEYACGQGTDLFKYMKQINHPAITEWANEFESYHNNLKTKLGVK
ncbi:MAG: hypothetical protein IJC88_06235 [Oscillospiraceae bacterium]|nr:hypothetical protein [Oscillospiraceae bacterium]